MFIKRPPLCCHATLGASSLRATCLVNLGNESFGRPRLPYKEVGVGTAHSVMFRQNLAVDVCRLELFVVRDFFFLVLIL